MNQINDSQIQSVDYNILKCRDDHEPIYFEKADDNKFRLRTGIKCSWLNGEKAFEPAELRPRIEPWLTALAQSEHFSLLVGSGLSHAIHKIATGNNMPGMQRVEFNVFNNQIEQGAQRSAELSGRGKHHNIEDQIRVANELLQGIIHYCPESARFRGSGKLKKNIHRLKIEISSVLKNFAESILNGEKNITKANEEQRDSAFNYLVNFLISFASRSGTRDRLQIFTTNYDRLIEAGAEIAGIHLMDRFIGNLTPIFRSSRLNIDMHYNPPGIRGEPRYLEGVAHFTKLHGSLDWVWTGKMIRRIGLPFGAESVNSYLKIQWPTGVDARSLMIYPNSAKDQETAEYPYVELFRDFASAICRPNNTLVTYGYSFGDEHINRVIDDMLTIPSTHLVIISYNDSPGWIMRTYKKVDRPAQITLLVGNQLGDLKNLVDYYLPKPAIDRTTFRMAELLKARLGVERDDRNDRTDKKEGEK